MLYDYLYKIILIGESGVGKSTFFSRLINRPTDENSTIGIELGNTLSVVPDGTVIKINIWDTAGQEFYHSIVKNYYRDIVGAIFLFDISDKQSFDKIKTTWFDEFLSCNQTHISNILVGNKSDLGRQVPYEDALTFATDNHMEYYEISSTHCDDVFFFHTYIEDIYHKMPLEITPGMGIRLPPILEEKEPRCCIIN